MRWKDGVRDKRTRLEEIIISAIPPFMSVNNCRDLGKIPKLKIVCIGTKPALYLFTEAFLGRVVREKVVVLPDRNRIL